MLRVIALLAVVALAAPLSAMSNSEHAATPTLAAKHKVCPGTLTPNVAQELSAAGHFSKLTAAGRALKQGYRYFGPGGLVKVATHARPNTARTVFDGSPPDGSDQSVGLPTSGFYVWDLLSDNDTLQQPDSTSDYPWGVTLIMNCAFGHSGSSLWTVLQGNIETWGNVMNLQGQYSHTVTRYAYCAPGQAPCLFLDITQVAYYWMVKGQTMRGQNIIVPLYKHCN